MRWMPNLFIFYTGLLVFAMASLAPTAVQAEQWLSGSVQHVDRNRESLTLVLNGSGASIRVVAVSGQIAPNIHPGSTVQVWGDFQSRRGNLFVARRIVHVDSRRSPSDPTGVRKRLMRRFRP